MNAKKQSAPQTAPDKANQDNRANQLNPNNDAYESSRGTGKKGSS